MPASEPRLVRVPGDKSITHRALLAAALATGQSRIRGALDAGDTGSTRRVLRALGVRIEARVDGELLVTGQGLRGLAEPADVLDCGNSGTTARLLLGILAAQPLTATLSGDASLRARPMRRVTGPLRQMGAQVRELVQPDRLPIEIAGSTLQPIEHTGAAASAQVKSAILLAGLTGGVPVAVTEPLVSRDHTERLLRSLGVPVTESASATGHRVALAPVPALPPLDLTVPGDVSAAAFLLAAALLLGRAVRIPDVGVNPTRTGLLPVLARMGAHITLAGMAERGGEPTAELQVEPGPLAGTVVEPGEIPGLIDEVPVLAVLAAAAEGETRITGAGELRIKESDRIAALVGNLRALGVTVEELPDGLAVQGGARPLRGRVRTEGDHRIAMAFGLLAAVPGNQIRIDMPDAAGVSFPGFWQVLRALGGSP